MSVVVTFKNKPARYFPEAQWAFMRDGAMIVKQQCADEQRFDGAEVVSARVTLETGEEVIVPGEADSKTPP